MNVYHWKGAELSLLLFSLPPPIWKGLSCVIIILTCHSGQIMCSCSRSHFSSQWNCTCMGRGSPRGSVRHPIPTYKMFVSSIGSGKFKPQDLIFGLRIWFLAQDLKDLTKRDKDLKFVKYVGGNSPGQKTHKKRDRMSEWRGPISSQWLLLLVVSVLYQAPDFVPHLHQSRGTFRKHWW